MVAVFMMIVGAIFAVIGFAGLLALSIEPLYEMFAVIFWRKKEYVLYESKQGKALLQRNKKEFRGSCWFFLVAGIVLFAAGWFLRFGARGTDSLFSKQVEQGTNQGDAEAQNREKQSINSSGNYVDSEGQEYEYYIIVDGKNIIYRNEFKGDIEAFEGYVKELNGKRQILLVDDFAVASVYHRVEELLEYYGMNYVHEGEGE